MCADADLLKLGGERLLEILFYACGARYVGLY